MPVLSGDGQQAFYWSHTRIATSAGAGIGFSSGQVGQSCEIADPVNVGAGDYPAATDGGVLYASGAIEESVPG